MCILAMWLSAHPDVTVLSVHLRDEFFSRPVVHPTRRTHTPGEVLFGRDHAGGTWAGYNPATRVYAALTNVRDKTPPPAAPASRGELVAGVLRDGGGGGGDGGGTLRLADVRAAAASSGGVLRLGGRYAGFNLVVADVAAGEAYFVTNRRAAASGDTAAPLESPDTAVVQRLPVGAVHAISNSPTPNDEAWAKVQWVRRQLGDTASSLPTLAELRLRYGRPRLPSGASHAADLGAPGTAHGETGASDSASGAADALANHAGARQHAHHAWEGDADVDERAELALVEDAIRRVAATM